jgi:hypothetical protein
MALDLDTDKIESAITDLNGALAVVEIIADLLEDEAGRNATPETRNLIRAHHSAMLTLVARGRDLNVAFYGEALADA